MAVCIPTYTMASSLIGNGMTWWQALLTVFLGNLIVLIPMTLNAHPGTAYGIPFPVLLRASFGTRGANIAALLRGGVACGWFGIQTWFGGAALHATLAIIFGFDTTSRFSIESLGITAAQFGCFLIFWAMNVFFIWNGMESIKWLEKLSAPFLLFVGVLVMIPVSAGRCQRGRLGSSANGVGRFNYNTKMGGHRASPFLINIALQLPADRRRRAI